MTRQKSNDDALHQPPASSAPTPYVWFDYRPWFLALVLVLVTFAAYQPVWRAGVIWDDEELVTDNRMVQAPDGLRRMWLTTDVLGYWPLTSSAWWLEWRLWGNHPTGYHAVNVLLHAINAVLVWAILWRLKVPGSWLAGCVFALHPVNVASVAWISEQKNMLSMLFYLIAILLYLRFDEEGGWRWYGFSLGAFLLALLSKTAVVMLPVVLLGCIWWMRGRVRREDFLRSLPFFVLSLVMGLVTISFQYPRAVGGHAPQTEGFFTRLAVAGSTPWFYLYKTLLPINLTVIYPKWDIDASPWTAFAPGIILLGCLTWFWRRRKSWARPLLFGLGYFVVTLFPVSGFFHQSFHLYSFVADHWLYHSIAGVIALVVAAGVEICRRLGHRGRSVGVVVGVGVMIALGAATWDRACVYAADQTLWRDTLTKNPKAWVAHDNLGIDLEHAGKIEEAIAHYEQALRIEPDYAEAHYHLGNALAQTGKIEEAIAHFEQALRIEPDDAEAHYNLGNVFLREGKVSDAIGHYEQALRSNPDYAEAHYNCGVALELVDRMRDAITHYEYALQIKPDYAEAHNNLGIALKKAGMIQEAMAHYEQALRIKPDYAEAHYNLGNALAQVDRLPEAILQYEQALQIKPDFTQAQNALARLQARQ
jgi:tetratricopeptide (TPR) repeat protein